MSLEESIIAMTKALAENTAEVRKLGESTVRLMELREDAITKVSAAAAPAKKATAKKAEKVEDAEEVAQTKGNISESPEDRKDPADKADDLSSEVRQSIIDYVTVEDVDEREKRKAKVKEYLTKVGASGASEIPDNKKQAFINTMKKLLKEAQKASPEEDLL